MTQKPRAGKSLSNASLLSVNKTNYDAEDMYVRNFISSVLVYSLFEVHRRKTAVRLLAFVLCCNFGTRRSASGRWCVRASPSPSSFCDCRCRRSSVGDWWLERDRVGSRTELGYLYCER
jgi:hypothetical protein